MRGCVSISIHFTGTDRDSGTALQLLGFSCPGSVPAGRQSGTGALRRPQPGPARMTPDQQGRALADIAAACAIERLADAARATPANANTPADVLATNAAYLAALDSDAQAYRRRWDGATGGRERVGATSLPPRAPDGPPRASVGLAG